MEDITFAFADLDDKESIETILADCNLPFEDIPNHIRNFILAKDGGRIVGTVGLEVLGEFGLLRSLAVDSSYRGRGIGKLLCDEIVKYASVQNLRQLYLLTNTAEVFFREYGFIKVERNSAPEIVKSTNEFKMICCSSAVCMMKRIDFSDRKYQSNLSEQELKT